MPLKFRIPTQTLIFGGVAAWSALLVSCVLTDRAIVALPQIPGATLVGSQACAKCHANITRGFHDATHAHLTARGEDGKAKDVSCESCHGGGSLHVKAGTRQTILNPKNSPETCLQCHANTRAEFSLPHTHPVLAGKIACTNCHEPHRGEANAAGGARSLVTQSNATCAKCHPAQTQHYTFPHEAMREGCVSCHSPHGSVNDKMLKARGTSLCYQCHFQSQTSGTQIMHGGVNHSGNVIRGTCWTAGCHEAVHGSNVNSNLRY
jgi:predicted CXXCH cytochrome family protein